MENYRITIMATVVSSLSRRDLEAKLVAALFDIETEVKISDGDNEQFEIVDYELTEAVPIGEEKPRAYYQTGEPLEG